MKPQDYALQISTFGMKELYNTYLAVIMQGTVNATLLEEVNRVKHGKGGLLLIGGEGIHVRHFIDEEDKNIPETRKLITIDGRKRKAIIGNKPIDLLYYWEEKEQRESIMRKRLYESLGDNNPWKSMLE